MSERHSYVVILIGISTKLSLIYFNIHHFNITGHFLNNRLLGFITLLQVLYYIGVSKQSENLRSGSNKYSVKISHVLSRTFRSVFPYEPDNSTCWNIARYIVERKMQ